MSAPAGPGDSRALLESRGGPAVLVSARLTKRPTSRRRGLATQGGNVRRLVAQFAKMKVGKRVKV